MHIQMSDPLSNVHVVYRIVVAPLHHFEDNPKEWSCKFTKSHDILYKFALPVLGGECDKFKMGPKTTAEPNPTNIVANIANHTAQFHNLGDNLR